MRAARYTTVSYDVNIDGKSVSYSYQVKEETLLDKLKERGDDILGYAKTAAIFGGILVATPSIFLAPGVGAYFLLDYLTDSAPLSIGAAIGTSLLMYIPAKTFFYWFAVQTMDFSS